MSALQNNAGDKSKITPDSEFPDEVFDFTWNISNYSTIEDSVSINVSTTCKAMVWEFKLKLEKVLRAIYIKRNFPGGPVYVDFNSRIKTCHGTLHQETTKTFENNIDWKEIFLFLPYDFFPYGKIHPLQFESDILIFNCTMIISDHAISGTEKSSDFQFHSRYLSNEQEYYMTISDGKNRISVQKETICAMSPVFRKLFQLGLLGTANRDIQIEDIDFATLEEFVSFLHTRELEHLNWDSAKKLYCVADKYEVQDLRNMCSQFFLSHLTVHEACCVLQLADDHMDSALAEAVVNFIQMHVSSVMLTEGWGDLVKRHPKLAIEALE